MARKIFGALLVMLAAWLLIDALFASDREKVESLVESLLDAGRRGGDEAVEEILASLALDYRGSGPFAREGMERRLREVMGGERRLEKLGSGSYRAMWKGGEMVVPILSLQAKARGQTQGVVLTLFFVEEDSGWKIADITRVQWGQ